MGRRPRTVRRQATARIRDDGGGERVGQRVGMLEEAAGDRLVARVETQREVGGEERRRVGPGRVVGVGHGARSGTAAGHPLPQAGREEQHAGDHADELDDGDRAAGAKQRGVLATLSSVAG